MSTLQQLLNLGLVDVGADDSRFEKLQASAVALAAKIQETPELLIPSTLLSLDDAIDEGDPMFALIEQLVTAEWKTLRNSHVNRPRELLRAVAIDSISSTIEGAPENAAIVWNTAASLLRHKQCRIGRADPVVAPLLMRAARDAEAAGVARMNLAESSDETAGDQSERAQLRVDSDLTDDEIIADIARAVGPQYPPVPTLPSPNPHWSNAGTPWSNEYTPRMTAAMVKAVNLGTSRVVESLTTELESLQKHLADAQSQTIRSAISSRVRLNVLWWSESLYSPSLQLGYREVALPVAAAAAAVDLAAIVPPLSPASVSYLLGEALHRIAQLAQANGRHSVISFLHELATAKPSIELAASLKSNSRTPLLTVAAEACTGTKISASQLHARCGVDADLQLSPPEFAMWLFRDLQARRLGKSGR